MPDKHLRLINDITSTDEQLGPSLRSLVYEFIFIFSAAAAAAVVVVVASAVVQNIYAPFNGVVLWFGCLQLSSSCFS